MSRAVTVQVSSFDPILKQLEEQGTIDINTSTEQAITVTLDSLESVLSKLVEQEIITLNVRTAEAATATLQVVPAILVQLTGTGESIYGYFPYTFPFELA